MLSVRISKTFFKGFSLLSENDRKSVLKKIEAFRNEDENVDVKKLQPKESGYYRLRSGKYRIIFEYSESDEVTLLKIDNRDSIYLRF